MLGCVKSSITGDGETLGGRRGNTVTIEAMFLLFLSLPNLAAAAVLECSREVRTRLYANAGVWRRKVGTMGAGCCVPGPPPRPRRGGGAGASG